jgi:hypothetical protein
MHQAIDTHVIPAVAPPLPGDHDLWQLEVAYEGGGVSCKKLRTFLYYLASQSSHAVAIDAPDARKGLVPITLFGPKADDGNRLYIVYEATRIDCQILTTEQQKLFAEHLGRLSRTGRKEKLGSYSASTACAALKLPSPPALYGRSS